MALEEFEALESQVLREAGNSRSLAALASPARKRAEASRGLPSQARSSGCAVGAPLAAVGVEQAQDEDANEDEGVFQSDGEEHVHRNFVAGRVTQAATAGTSHPLARRAAAVVCPQRAPGPALPPRVYQDEEEDEEEGEQEGEMHAEVGAGAFQAALADGQWLLSDIWRRWCSPACTHCMRPLLVPPRFLQPSFVHDLLQPPPTSGLVHKFFARTLPPPAAAAAAGRRTQQHHRQEHYLQQQQPCEASAAELEAVEQLQAGVVRLQEERAQVARLRLELEERTARLGQEQAAFEKRKVGGGGAAG